jgi:hypothetical protein
MGMGSRFHSLSSLDDDSPITKLDSYKDLTVISQLQKTGVHFPVWLGNPQLLVQEQTPPICLSFDTDSRYYNSRGIFAVGKSREKQHHYLGLSRKNAPEFGVM